MKLTIVDPAVDPRWQAMAERTEAGLIHSPPWMRALTGAYGFPIEAAIVEGSESAQGIAYCHVDGVWRSGRLASDGRVPSRPPDRRYPLPAMGRRLFYKFNASDLEFLRMRANSLLLWEGLRLARSLGCIELDLGLSDDDQPGLIRFKRQFGAVEREVRHMRWTPPGWRDERGDQVQALIRRLTVLLTDPETPDELAARAGEILYPVFA